MVTGRAAQGFPSCVGSGFRHSQQVTGGLVIKKPLLSLSSFIFGGDFDLMLLLRGFHEMAHIISVVSPFENP